MKYVAIRKGATMRDALFEGPGSTNETSQGWILDQDLTLPVVSL